MFTYDAVQLFDLGFGPFMVPVTPPDCDISPSSMLQPKHRGKAPGVLTQSGWTSLDVNNPKFRCHDYATANLWREGWGANVGFAVGDGYVVLDNDQGREFSEVLRKLLPDAPRRSVQDPRHERDAFFVRVLDFVGDGARVNNQEKLIFRNGVRVAKIQVLAQGKQAVIGGLHPGTRTLYCWDRELTDISDIPAISENEFDRRLGDFAAELSSRGWTLEGAPTRSTVFVSAAPQPVSAAHGASPDLLSEARLLLAQIPNRDIPSNITPSPVDSWLDDYHNWVSVAYALVAFLGALAHDPEAEALWLEWSDGRAQHSQPSLSVWRSALHQPNLKYGSIGLRKLVESLVGKEPLGPGDFSDDIAPDDPSLQTKFPVWEAIRARWAFCAAQSGFVDMALSRPVINKEGFSGEHAHLRNGLKAELGYPRKRQITVADMFLARNDKQQLRDITYAPGDPLLIETPDHPNLPLFNQWRATTVSARLVTDNEIKPWLDHLEFVLGSLHERDRFLRWCAFTVQHPELKPNWHYLVMSVQGLGKDTMTKPIKLAVGDDNRQNWCEHPYKGGEFTYAIEYKLLIISEIAQPKDTHASGHGIGTKLKSILAKPPDHLEINKKNMHPYYIPNRIAVVMFSNEGNPVYLEPGQRRIHVVNRRNQKVRDHSYYLGLHDWLENGGAELAASYLLAYPLTQAEKNEFIGGVAPASDDKEELEQKNLHPGLQALIDLIHDAREGVQDGTPWTLVATSKDLCQMIRDRNLRVPPTERQVGEWLLDMEREGKGVHRRRIDPKKPNQCGAVWDTKNNTAYRLWLLADKTYEGKDFASMTNTELFAHWQNQPSPPSATVLRPNFGAAASAFPNNHDDELI